MCSKANRYGKHHKGHEEFMEIRAGRQLLHRSSVGRCERKYDWIASIEVSRDLTCMSKIAIPDCSVEELGRTLLVT